MENRGKCDITFLKLMPIVIVVGIWGRLLANKTIIFQVNNQALVYILNKQTSKNRHVMALIRLFVLHAMTNNVYLKPNICQELIMA